MKLKEYKCGDNAGNTWKRMMFYCPGCKSPHSYDVGKPTSPNWSFNGDHERPTFAPSLLVFVPEVKPGVDLDHAKYPEDYTRKTLCHLFVENGRIRYCTDSPHALSGQIVDLPDLPADYLE